MLAGAGCRSYVSPTDTPPAIWEEPDYVPDFGDVPVWEYARR